MKTKQLIHFDQKQFNVQALEYKKAIHLEADILKELNNFLPNKLKELPDYKEALNVLYKTLEATPANTMALSGDTIADLQKLNLTKLKTLVTSYEPLQPPTIAEFSTYAETPEQQSRLEAFKSILSAYKRCIELDSTLKPFGIVHLLPYRCAIDHTNQTIIPNVEYILTGTFKIYG